MFDDDPEQDLAILTYIHDRIIEASGGTKGFHNEGLIRSALARPNHSVMGEDAEAFFKERSAYPTYLIFVLGK